VFCGKPFSGLLPNDDISVCNGIGADGLTSGQLNEVYDDQGDFAINASRIRQMFDFTGRTGTIVYDVDAKINPCNLGHGWWTELWVTEDPAPIPYHEAPGVLSYPRNGFGINFQGLNTCPQGRTATEISGILVTKDFKILHAYAGWTLGHDSDEDRCITTKDQKMNRFKILINKDTVEVWGSNIEDPENPHRMAVISDADLPFEKGYVHLEHSQYNGRKDGCENQVVTPGQPALNGTITGVQTYRWDNVGFDGPTYATPRSYEVPYNTEPEIDNVGGYMYGYRINADDWTALPTLSNVDLDKAKGATLDYSFLGTAGSGFSVLFRVNGGPTHTYVIPDLFSQDGAARNGLRAFTNAIPLEELVQGDNVLEFMTSVKNDDPEQYVGNVELTVNL